MHLASLLALAVPFAAPPQAYEAGDPPAKPAPRMEREPDLKALDAPAPQTPFAELLRPPRPSEARVSGVYEPGRSDLADLALSTRSIDRVHWDSDCEGALWVRGADYKARVHAGGLDFIPFLGSHAERSWPLALGLVQVSLDGELLPLAPAQPERRGETEVVLAHGPLREVHRFALDSVEQLFEIDSLPRRGALRLELEVTSDLAAAEQADGLRFDGPEGGVRYGNLTVLDADGRRLEVASRLAQGRVRLDVPADFVAAARLPLVLDPLITTFGVAVGPVNCLEVDVAYEPTNDRYLVAWAEVFSGSDTDVNSILVSAAGSLLGSEYIDFSTSAWRYPSVAANALDATFLVGAEREYSQIWGRIRPSSGAAAGLPFPIATDLDGYLKRDVSVGGDLALSGPTYYLVTFTREFSQTDSDIHAQLVSGTGIVVGPTILIDNSGGTLDFLPLISRSNGKPPFATQRWNVTWARGPVNSSSFVQDLYAAQLSWDGVLVTQPFNLTGTPAVLEALESQERGVTAPLDDPSGKEREWAVYFGEQHALQTFGTVRLLRGNQPLDTEWIGTLNGGSNGNHYDGKLDSDGVTLSMAVASSDRVAAHTFKTTGHQLSGSEGPIQFDPTNGLTADASYVLRQSSTTGGPRGLIVVNEGPGAWYVDGDVFGAIYESRDHALGSLACNSNPNSTGYMGYLTAVGSAKVSENRVTLECQNLPASQVGIVIASKNSANVPFGQGVLCLGSPLYRFKQPLFSGAGDTMVLDLNLNALPAGMVVQPGQTWHFQLWHRDGAQVNFSNSVAIPFQ